MIRSTQEARARINKIQNARYHNCPFSKLRHIVSSCVAKTLRTHGCRKGGSVLAFLPYSIPQLKAHLESQFNNVNGFTWENHGKLWHIDHIIPQSLFHYTSLDSKAFRDCWALSNLQPLEIVENLKKHNKLNYKGSSHGH